jgi:ArsR family transcriptional regulator, arsenate/arsenite/antimonite-responsive transcriptional repressor
MEEGWRSELRKEEGGASAFEKNDLAVFCKALGHPMRVEIITQLRAFKNCLCGDLVDRLPVAQATVSQHLKILKQAGLVKRDRNGPRTYYVIDPKNLDRFKALTSAL